MKENHFQLNRALKWVKEAQTLLILTGAGISTDSGIPDFRGPHGLYENSAQKFGLPYPEAIFELPYFKKNPNPFYHFASELMRNEYNPSLFHQLLAELQPQKQRILIVTQNIDGLHQKAGSNEVIPCHGDMTSASCSSCSTPYPIEAFNRLASKAEVPLCETCGAPVKPDVVFFGENLPESFYELYLNPPEVDLFIAAGTSLTVHPAAGFAAGMAEKCQSIRLNLQSTPYDSCFDICLNMQVEEFSKQVSRTGVKV